MYACEREDRQTTCVQALLKYYCENISSAASVLELQFGLEESEKNECIIGPNPPKFYEN